MSLHTLRFFLDTSFVIALLNSKDLYHLKAKSLRGNLQNPGYVYTTEAVLVEIGNSLSATYRVEAASFINRCYATANMLVVNVSINLMREAVKLYYSRQDKEWGLTDCISFIVMDEYSISQALTADKHFQQAGYRALLRE